MAHKFSLAFLTVKDIRPVDMVRVASETGYDFIGFRLLPAGSDGPCSILTDRKEQRNVVAALHDTGIQVADIEVVRIGESFDVNSFSHFFEVCSYLGAKHLLVVGDDTDRARLINNCAIFLEKASEFGLSDDLEFMPWTAVPTVDDCLEIVRAVGKENAGLLVDALHWERSNRDIDCLIQIPESLVTYIQLCDALRMDDLTTEQLVHAARSERLVPGTGNIDLVGMLSALPLGKIYSVEVPRDQDSLTKSAHIRAEEALFAAKSIVESIA